METANPHNLPAGDPNAPRRFGLRVTAPAQDPFLNLVGKDWETFQWFPTAAERDHALAEMKGRHRFSRDTDSPSIVLQAVER
jgi:hypothetical protein